jgi:hypothetical protein
MMANSTTCLVTFNRGDPPQCGRYLVTDGDEYGVDLWWEYVGGRVRLGSQIGKPGEGITRRWAQYENVIAWAELKLPDGVFEEVPIPLDPCPFCSTADPTHHSSEDGNDFIECTLCGARVPGMTGAVAINKWNSRASAS